MEEITIERPKLEELARQQMAWIEGCMASGAQTDWTPHLCVFGRKFDEAETGLYLCALAVGFNEDHEKRHTLLQVGRRFYRDHIVPLAVVFSSEAWVATNPPPGTQPRDCPDRREILLVVATTLGFEHCCMASSPIVRTNGHIGPTQFGPLNSEAKFPLLTHFFNGFFGELPDRLQPPEFQAALARTAR